jgi:hypothetical protein
MKTGSPVSVAETSALRRVAQRLFWWKTPDEALQFPARFVAQVMTFGTWLDVKQTRQALGDEAFQAVLRDPPAGVFDEKSWHYWHAVFHLVPVPPLPRRKL